MIAILLKTNDLLYLQVQYNKRLLVTGILKKKKNLLKSKNREEWRKKTMKKRTQTKNCCKKQKKHKKIRWVEKELWAKLQELNQNFAKIKEPKKLYNKK